MPKITDVLTLDLQEDIKNVIDLEDRSEAEIQQEIDSYIVTDGIGRHLDFFTNQYTSHIKETGVWISGFYGSGKSYFGKMLGYIIANPLINGTPARERFIPRLKGITNEGLIENAIRKLDATKNRVVFLDIAKQSTENGLAFTLFTNLLKNLGFRDDIYGYIEFDLYIEGKYDEFKQKIKSIEGDDWDNLKLNQRLVAKAMRNAHLGMDYSEDAYKETLDTYSASIRGFSANKLKNELEKYLKVYSDETLVFVFDEASEAISQEKFTLLDLEGISEAFSSISNKVWTIAIAQEKLDDVINNTNVSRSQLTKVTDRFKTKIHLESTEVDVIIRSRLLQKKDIYFNQLIEYYKNNEGLISDATNLKSTFPTKTTSAEDFATYYPFHKYQFDILQKFLFSSNALVHTQIAARGMIITTFDVLRKQMRDQALFNFTTGYAICVEAQTAPPVGLVNKYDTALKVLKEANSDIQGEHLLKTIHLLSDSEVVSPTVENITKSYIADISAYYSVKPKIEVALTLLVESKVLLLANNNYKITSDLEGKLLEEMNDFDVELFSKKRSLIKALKDYKTFNPISTLSEGTDTFKFSVISDLDDELCSGNKQLKLTVYSLFNINGERQDFVEQLKLETQYAKESIALIPDNTEFSAIDKLIAEISSYSFMEEKYANETDGDKRQIIRDFGLIREEKEKDLHAKVEKAYFHGSLIYMYDEFRLNADTFKGTISDTQRKVVKNTYTKRLATQLSESLVPKIFSTTKDHLHGLFSGNDFNFFDANGNFVGEHLKVIEEINVKIKTQFVDGKTLEADLSVAPWGYSFGTLASTLAALLRSGRLSVKFNGDTYFSHEQKSVHEAFTNTTKFKSASFKSVTATLSSAAKTRAVQLLMDLEIATHTNRKVGYEINDFDLADAIRALAESFIGELTGLTNSVADFEPIFPTTAEQKAVLLNYSGKVTENNYIDKVEQLLATEDDFKTAIQTILKTQKFIKKNFEVVKDLKRFIESVVAELKKAGRTDNSIQEAHDEFLRLYTQDMVKNFAQLQQQAQLVKDGYFKLLKTAALGMSHEYQLLNGKVDAAIRTLKNYPADLNTSNSRKLEELKGYCDERSVGEPSLDFSITCKACGYSLSDILNYIALAPNKEHALVLIQSGFIDKSPAPEPDNTGETQPAPKAPRKIKLQIPSQVMSVQEYKSLLSAQLSALAAANPNEQIEIAVELSK
jgi:hypothetical protein